jgi:DNA repair exonuclease SbcCD nuclease subunit
MGEANLQPGMLQSAFDYIALGHYHDFHEHKPNAFYAGATERFGFGEVDSAPGFAIVEFDSGGLKNVEHVEIAARRMLDLKKISAREMDAAALTEEVRKRTSDADLDGAIVRQRVYDVRHGVASGMDRELLRDLGRHCLNFSLEIHAEERPEDMERNGSQNAVFGPLGEEFAAFVKERKERGELEEGFAGEFLEKGRAYLTRAASEEPGSPEGSAA